MENKDKIEETIKGSNIIAIDTSDLNAIGSKLQALDNQADIIRDNLIEGISNDYSVIPGTGKKPSLLLPGARKIALMFGLTTKFDVVEKEKANEGLKVRYVIKAQLYLKDIFIAESFGAAHNFSGKMEKMDENSILKMAQKRAFVGAIMQVSNLSKLFTQDVEDMPQTQTNQYNPNNSVADAEKKERFAFYGVIQKKFKLSQPQTKEKVRELIAAFNEANKSNYRTILDLSPAHFKQIMEENK